VRKGSRFLCIRKCGTVELGVASPAPDHGGELNRFGFAVSVFRIPVVKPTRVQRFESIPSVVAANGHGDPLFLRWFFAFSYYWQAVGGEQDRDEDKGLYAGHLISLVGLFGFASREQVDVSIDSVLSH
jgi:hypothetical protein